MYIIYTYMWYQYTVYISTIINIELEIVVLLSPGMPGSGKNLRTLNDWEKFAKQVDQARNFTVYHI